jgi:hypothetical protein
MQIAKRKEFKFQHIRSVLTYWYIYPLEVKNVLQSVYMFSPNLAVNAFLFGYTIFQLYV